MAPGARRAKERSGGACAERSPLFNLGDADISIGELTLKGYYLGSNVSYNVHKLSENGYRVYERSEHDRRSIRVRLTAKGRTLRNREMLDRHNR
jgi:DNA-binding MarR family transcriptional regulator